MVTQLLLQPFVWLQVVWENGCGTGWSVNFFKWITCLTARRKQVLWSLISRPLAHHYDTTPVISIEHRMSTVLSLHALRMNSPRILFIWSPSTKLWPWSSDGGLCSRNSRTLHIGQTMVCSHLGSSIYMMVQGFCPVILTRERAWECLRERLWERSWERLWCVFLSVLRKNVHYSFLCIVRGIFGSEELKKVVKPGLTFQNKLCWCG